MRPMRAWTLLNTITMENVAWPTITENNPSPMPSGSSTVLNVLFRATPVTMPGSAIGRTTSRFTVLLPKKS